MENDNKYVVVRRICVILAICLVVCAICNGVQVYYVSSLNKEIAMLEEEKSSMQLDYERQKVELSEKVTLLSNQLTVLIEAEEAQAQKQVPSGLPVSGKIITIESEPVLIVATEIEGTGVVSEENGTMAENAGADGQDGENIVTQEIPTVVFGVKKGTQIVSAGAGVVSHIESSNNGTTIVIEHGNGYKTVYLFKGTAKIKMGDEVLRGTLLFEVTSNNAEFSFQIMLDGSYVNPMDILEIRG